MATKSNVCYHVGYGDSSNFPSVSCPTNSPWDLMGLVGDWAGLGDELEEVPRRSGMHEFQKQTLTVMT